MFGKFLEKREDRETQEMVKNERIYKKRNRVKTRKKLIRQLYVRSGSLWVVGKRIRCLEN